MIKKFVSFILILLTLVLIPNVSKASVYEEDLQKDFHIGSTYSLGTYNYVYINKKDPKANNNRIYLEGAKDIFKYVHALSNYNDSFVNEEGTIYVSPEIEERLTNIKYDLFNIIFYELEDNFTNADLNVYKQTLENKHTKINIEKEFPKAINDLISYGYIEKVGLSYKKRLKKLHNVKYINDRPNEDIEVSYELYQLITLSENLKELTWGYFDISIGHIIDGWKEIIEGYENFTKEEINQKINDVTNLEVIEDGISYFEQDSKYYINIKDGVKIDLGAIAKGYAVDKVYDYLKASGLEYFKIHGSMSSLKFGKNIRRDKESPFFIKLNKPYNLHKISDLDKLLGNIPDKEVYGYFELENNSITTSGDIEQNSRHGDILLHHIISPETKRPENHYRMLTIIKEDATISDALTTALFSMDDETFSRWEEENNLDNFIVFNYDETINNKIYDYNFQMWKGRGSDILKTTLKDFVIISTVVIIAAVGFYMFSKAFRQITHDYAVVNYREKRVAVVDFKNEIIELYPQEDAEGYPIHNEENKTITILGAYQKGIRHEVVIKYDLLKHTMQIVEETSNDKICSSIGVSSHIPLECKPNEVIVLFLDFGQEDDFDEEI